MIISVIGGRVADTKYLDQAYEMGKFIASQGDYLVCGGYSGIMESVAKGAKDNGGTTIGILLRNDKDFMNPYIDIPIVTGLDVGRNVIIARTGDIVIAFQGSYGTLSEIAYSLTLEKSVIGIGTWDIEGVKQVKNIEQAKELYKEIKKKTIDRRQ